jgi:hypothetical protein
MKKIIIAVSMGIMLFGCTDKKAQKEVALAEVIKVHDKVMGADEHLMKNKMQLDTLLKTDTAHVKDTASLLRTKLMLADSAMETWMHKFDSEYKGKSDDDILMYMNDQKKQITTIDSQINVAVKESDQYLLRIKK